MAKLSTSEVQHDGTYEGTQRLAFHRFALYFHSYLYSIPEYFLPGLLGAFLPFLSTHFTHFTVDDELNDIQSNDYLSN